MNNVFFSFFLYPPLEAIDRSNSKTFNSEYGVVTTTLIIMFAFIQFGRFQNHFF
jgi:hypothetical protein